MWYIVVILLIIILINVIMYNIMLKKKNGIENSFSSLDAMLKRRYDLIPNIVSCVKGYMNYESETLTNIVKLRNEVINANNKKDILNKNEYLGSSIKEVIMVSESNPNLKANENFLKLQAILNDTEEHISAARRTYNAHVTDYNNFIQIIPNNIFASIFGFKQYDLFKITDDERKSRLWVSEK